MDAYPYWSVLLVPFVILAIALTPKYRYLNIILETIGCAGFVFVNMLRYNWTYFGNTLLPMIWPHILEGSRFDTSFSGSYIMRIVNALNQYTESPAAINSVFLAAIIALAYMSYPHKQISAQPVSSNLCNYHDVLTIRLIVNTIICLLPIMAMFV
jgi:hypothetical protein